MKTILSCAVILLISTVAGQVSGEDTSCSVSQGVLKKISWRALQDEGKINIGELAGESLKLENPTGHTKTFKLLSLRKPGITAPVYGITGALKYENVEGIGYLEMWSHFPGNKAYFSRTLGATGPLQSIQGSSKLRAFNLPFYVRDESGWLPDRPERIELNLVLPGRGTVYISAVTLFEERTDDHYSVSKSDGAWWSNRTSGIMGAMSGGVLGLLGAVIGILSSRGKGRRATMGVLWLMLILGACCLVAGIVAVILQQPYRVYYPLLLIGILATALPAALMRTVRRRYENLELRRMSAVDA